MKRSTMPKDVQKRIDEKFNNYKICRQCNKRNPEGASSCRKCGHSSADTSSSKWYRRKADEPRE